MVISRKPHQFESVRAKVNGRLVVLETFIKSYCYSIFWNIKISVNVGVRLW